MNALSFVLQSPQDKSRLPFLYLVTRYYVGPVDNTGSSSLCSLRIFYRYWRVDMKDDITLITAH